MKCYSPNAGLQGAEANQRLHPVKSAPKGKLGFMPALCAQTGHSTSAMAAPSAQLSYPRRAASLPPCYGVI
eukprot:scaffold4838_cov15-Tisochrysis_lutea.AAC.1